MRCMQRIWCAVYGGYNVGCVQYMVRAEYGVYSGWRCGGCSMQCVQWIWRVQYNGYAVHHMASGVCSVWCVQCMVCAEYGVYGVGCVQCMEARWV